SARRDRARPRRRDSGRVDLQLLHEPARVLQRRNGQLVVGARRLLHQEDRLTRAGRWPWRRGDFDLHVSKRKEFPLWQWMLAAPKAASSPTSTSRRSSTSCWCCSSS